MTIFVGIIIGIAIIYFLRSFASQKTANQISTEIEIRESTLADIRVTNLIRKFEQNNFTQEQIKLIIFTFDMALLADEWITDKTNFENTIKVGTLFSLFPVPLIQMWKKQRKISYAFADYIFEISCYFKNDTILETRNVLLDYLNDEEANSGNFCLLTEKIKARIALRDATSKIESNSDMRYISNVNFCISSSIKIMNHIVNQTKEKPGSTNSTIETDTSIVAGLFLLVFTNHLTRLLGLDFEPVSTATINLFLGKEIFEKHISSIISTYNAAQTKSSFAAVLGSHFAEWINFPTSEKLNKLLELYTLFLKNAQVDNS